MGSSGIAQAPSGERQEDEVGAQLTTLTAVDGRQVPVQTPFIGQQGRSNTGRSVAAAARAGFNFRAGVRTAAVLRLGVSLPLELSVSLPGARESAS